MGKKKQPTYRVVVADSRAPRDGRFIESIGFYNPRTEPPTVYIKEERALYWLSQGAQPTEAVARLLKNKGTLDRFARLKAGEDLETLLAEVAAEEAEAEEVVEEVVAEEVPPEEEVPAGEEVPAEEAVSAEEVAPEEVSAEEVSEPEEEAVEQAATPGEEATEEVSTEAD